MFVRDFIVYNQAVREMKKKTPNGEKESARVYILYDKNYVSSVMKFSFVFGDLYDIIFTMNE